MVRGVYQPPEVPPGGAGIGQQDPREPRQPPEAVEPPGAGRCDGRGPGESSSNKK